MKKSKKSSELFTSYQAMVEAVEDFVEKEGKTLQQAFHAAEEKLGEASEIGKEKIAQASKDLKDNLRVFGEAVEGASDAYKEQLKFDVAFLNSTILEKLQSIANSNTVELIEFTKSLREQAKTATTESHLADHQEHSEWDSEHAFWLDEIELWKKDHNQAMVKLSAIEQAMKQHESSLLSHIQAIEAHAKAEHEHEESMSNAETDFTSEHYKENDESGSTEHKQERSMHAQQAHIHQEMKTHHYKVMAMVNMLYKEMHLNK